MVDSNKNIAWDKLLAEVEAPGFKKSTGEFTFTIVTPKKYEDLAKAFMDRVASLGVFFFKPCKVDEIDGLLQGSVPKVQGQVLTPDPGPQTPDPGCLVDVTTLADLFGVTVRTVQLDAEKWPEIRNVRGQYDTLVYCKVLRQAVRDAETAQGDDQRTEKTLILRQQRIKLEARNKETLGQLLNAEKTRQAIEYLESEERQALLNMPKTMGPQCDMLPGREVEIKLMEWVRRYLKDQSAWDRIINLVRTALSSLQTGPQDKGKKRKKKK